MLQIQDVLQGFEPKTFLLHSSGAETATGNSADVDVSKWTSAIFYLDVTAASGASPTLDVTIRGYDPVGNDYYTIVTFTQRVGTGTERIALALLLDHTIDALWTIGGTTPSFTFSLNAVLKR